MSEFLIERYLSRAAHDTAPSPADLSGAAERLSAEGRPVELVHSVFVPADETWFHLFQADSDRDVLEVAARCGLHFERMVEVRSDWTANAHPTRQRSKS